MILQMDSTFKLVAELWLAAERHLQTSIESYSPDAGEEFITNLFHMKFAEELTMASNRRSIEQVFLEDLERCFPMLRLQGVLREVSQGLVADVTLHERATESETGGDLGLVVIRPEIRLASRFLKIRDYRRGVLVQAKLRRRNGRWGSLTRRQREVLPGRLSYLALLLYAYEDTSRHSLRPFEWQLCETASLDEVELWLKCGAFPSLTSAAEIIDGLGHGTLGTADDKVLDEVISPAGNRALVITIDWPFGGHPGSEVSLL